MNITLNYLKKSFIYKTQINNALHTIMYKEINFNITTNFNQG